jgi:Zn-finger nucleic acid-binding protein
MTNSAKQERTIYCPKCVGRLEPAMFGIVEIDICYICQGIWFDKGELEDVINTEFSLSTFMKGVLDFSRIKDLDTRPHELNDWEGTCPICNEKMDQKKEKGILFDFCKNGHGAWLDHGELEYIIKKGLRVRYGIFYGVVIVLLLILTRGLLARAFSKGGFSRGLAGGAGATGGF